ncbi:MAG TPA: c-type cytochrome [Gemmatimonadales bacterium]
MTDEDVGPPEYQQADGVNGGRMYDKFWSAETNWSQVDPRNANLNKYADFFRCKQCHGWDRIGTAGSYVNRGPTTKRPNISAVNLVQVAQSLGPEALFEAIRRSTNRRPYSTDLSTYNPATNPTDGDKMPDYSELLTDVQIWELVRFLKVDAIDWTKLYDLTVTGSYPTGSPTYTNIGKDGDASRGDALFSAKCSWCHGSGGTAILVDGAAYTVGRHLRTKPYEDQHKIRFGQLGSQMPATAISPSEMKDLYKALTNTAKYPD